MLASTISSCLIGLALLCSQKPPPAPTPTPKPAQKPAATPTPAPPGLLQWLYNMVWPAGRFQGDLAKTVPETTEKTGKPDGISQVWLVNVEKGALTAWPNTRGAIEPAISADGKYLFYRRGEAIWSEPIQATAQNVVSGAASKAVAGVKITHLYGCTQDEAGRFALWVEATEGLRLVRFDPKTKTASLAALPNDGEWALADGRQLAEQLQSLRALRPDGFQVWVRNYRLIGRKDEKSDLNWIVKAKQRFFGSAAWVGEQIPFLFITGVENE
ncbi:MAG TPA: hypothetical protein VJ810_05975 [Blastocatellia bacterium]|nr:hypothetical protein [Blastocatellia bacterium]